MTRNATPSWATRTRRGIVSVWTAIMLFGLIVFIGLALDTGYVFLAGQQLQNAADAAALAGAAKVQFSSSAAVSDAITIAALNQAVPQHASVVVSSGDVVTGHFDRTTGAFTTGAVNAVKVTAHKSLPLMFGPIVGKNISNVSRSAVAMAGTFPAGIVTLDPTRVDISLAFLSSVQVPNGAIQVNSSNSGAVTLFGLNFVGATSLRVVGNIQQNFGLSSLPTVVKGVPAVSDPLASLPAPAKVLPAKTFTPPFSGSYNVTPGYYPNGITINNILGLTVNFAPGIYVLGPPGLQVLNVGNFNANGVMFYTTTGATPGNYGTISINGAGHVVLSAPTSGTYSGISLFTDRATPYGEKVQFNSFGANVDVLGTIYTPSVGLAINIINDVTVSNQVITGTLKLTGLNRLTVQYDGRNPTSSSDVFLVD